LFLSFETSIFLTAGSQLGQFNSDERAPSIISHEEEEEEN
jgi:hypothetical protein